MKGCGSEAHDVVTWESTAVLSFLSDTSDGGRGFAVEYSALEYDLEEIGESYYFKK